MERDVTDKDTLYYIREIFSELRNADISKEHYFGYVYSLLQDILNQSDEKQIEILQERLKRVQKQDFRYASGAMGRWAYAAMKKE